MTDEYADRLEEAVSQVVALGFSTGHADTFEELCLECVGNLANMRTKLADKQARISSLREGLQILSDGSTPWLEVTELSEESWEIMAKYAKELLERDNG